MLVQFNTGMPFYVNNLISKMDPERNRYSVLTVPHFLEKIENA